MAINKRNHLPSPRAEADPSDVGSAATEGEDISRLDIRPEKSLLSKFRFLLRHLWIVGIWVLAGLFIAIGYVMKAVPIYQATVVLQVAQEQERVYNPKDGADNGDDDLRGDDILNTITQTSTSCRPRIRGRRRQPPNSWPIALGPRPR
jgi:hypothetical protein